MSPYKLWLDGNRRWGFVRNNRHLSGVATSLWIPCEINKDEMGIWLIVFTFLAGCIEAECTWFVGLCWMICVTHCLRYQFDDNAGVCELWMGCVRWHLESYANYILFIIIRILGLKDMFSYANYIFVCGNSDTCTLTYNVAHSLNCVHVTLSNHDATILWYLY